MEHPDGLQIEEITRNKSAWNLQHDQKLEQIAEPVEPSKREKAKDDLILQQFQEIGI